MGSFSLIRLGFLSKPQLARISPREGPRVRHARLRGHDVSSFLSVTAYP